VNCISRLCWFVHDERRGIVYLAFFVDQIGRFPHDLETEPPASRRARCARSRWSAIFHSGSQQADGKAANLKKSRSTGKRPMPGSLLKPTMVLEGTRDGITDIGFEPTIFHPDKLPLEQISVHDAVRHQRRRHSSARTIDKMHATIPEFGPSTTSSASSGSPGRATIPTSCSRPSR
jgi:hypothetical protein